MLFEAGYISNVDDERCFATPEQRAEIVAALARAIEADVARSFASASPFTLCALAGTR